MSACPVPLQVTLIATQEAQVSPLYGLFETLNAFELLARFEPDLPVHPFHVEIAVPNRSMPRGGSGLPLGAHRTCGEIERTDIVILPLMMVRDPGWVTGRYPEVVRWLRHQHDQGATLASTCTGVLLLAETSLLDGHEATIHWAFAETFQQTFRVRVWPGVLSSGASERRRAIRPSRMYRICVFRRHGGGWRGPRFRWRKWGSRWATRTPPSLVACSGEPRILVLARTGVSSACAGSRLQTRRRYGSGPHVLAGFRPKRQRVRARGMNRDDGPDTRRLPTPGATDATELWERRRPASFGTQCLTRVQSLWRKAPLRSSWPRTRLSVTRYCGIRDSSHRVEQSARQNRRTSTMATRTASAVWNGTLKEGKGNMKYGSVEGPFTFASRFESGEGTNPEELVGAAHAGCYSMFLSALLSKQGLTPDSIETTATVELGQDDGPKNHLNQAQDSGQGVGYRQRRLSKARSRSQGEVSHLQAVCGHEHQRRSDAGQLKALLHRPRSRNCVPLRAGLPMAARSGTAPARSCASVLSAY